MRILHLQSSSHDSGSDTIYLTLCTLIELKRHLTNCYCYYYFYPCQVFLRVPEMGWACVKVWMNHSIPRLCSEEDVLNPSACSLQCR